VASSQTDII